MISETVDVCKKVSSNVDIRECAKDVYNKVYCFCCDSEFENKIGNTFKITLNKSNSTNVDLIKQFIIEYFDITYNDNDRIHKNNFVKYYNIHYNTHITWKCIINDVKKQITYNKCKRVNGLRGVIIGLKLKENKYQSF